VSRLVYKKGQKWEMTFHMGPPGVAVPTVLFTLLRLCFQTAVCCVLGTWFEGGGVHALSQGRSCQSPRADFSSSPTLRECREMSASRSFLMTWSERSMHNSDFKDTPHTAAQCVSCTSHSLLATADELLARYRRPFHWRLYICRAVLEIG